MQNTMNRREYVRINVGTEGTFFVRTEQGQACEFTGIIENVSEGGMCVQVDQATYEKVDAVLEVGQTLFFHSCDENGVGINKEMAVYHGEGKIVRKKVAENSIEVGCQVADKCQDFKEYVENKKVYLYVESIRGVSG